MIVGNNYTEAAVSQNVETYSSSIALNAETFNIIMSGIYNDKLLAAVREPIFNALDSHTEAGVKERAIKIHTPTTLEPWFCVQDFGMGMSKDTVTKLFMSLGTSTKRESNELVGAKGIGSKAPFAITDMFNVTSVYDGTRTSYSVYKDKGIPKVAVLSAQETTEPNGVEIKFSVEPRQVHEMREALYKCLSFVTSPYEMNDPYVQDVLASRKPKSRYSREIDGWRVEFYMNRKEEDNCVVMGQQPYLSETLREYPACAVFVPIGTCDVSPGREHTEEGEEDGGFSEKLKAFMEKVVKEMGLEITEALDKTSNITEAYEYFKNTPGSYFVSRFGYRWLRDKVYAVVGSDLALCNLSYEEARYGRSKSTRDERTLLTPLEIIKTPVVLYADKKSALKRKAEFLYQQHGMTRCFIVTPDDPGAMLANDDYFKPLFVYATSFNAPKQPTNNRGRTGNIRVCIVPRDGVGYSQWVNKSDMKEVEHYLIKKSKNQNDSTWMGSFGDIKRELGAYFDELGVEGNEIWFVTETAAKNLPTTAKLVTKAEFVKNNEHQYFKYLVRQTGVMGTKKQIREFFSVHTLDFKLPESFKSPFSHFEICNIFDYYTLRERAQAIKERYVKMYDRNVEVARKKYPLLERVGMHYYQSPEFKEYRDLIDNKGDKL